MPEQSGALSLMQEAASISFENNILNSKFKTSESAVSTILINDRDDDRHRQSRHWQGILCHILRPFWFECSERSRKVKFGKTKYLFKSSTKACRRTLNKCLILFIRYTNFAGLGDAGLQNLAGFQVRTFSTVVNIFKLLSIAIRCLPNFFLLIAVATTCQLLTFSSACTLFQSYFESLVRKI